MFLNLLISIGSYLSGLNEILEIQLMSYFEIRHLLKFSNLCLSDFKIRQIIDILRLSLSNFYETNSSRATG